MNKSFGYQTKGTKNLEKVGQDTYDKYEGGNCTQTEQCLHCSCHKKAAQNYKADLL